MSHDNSIEDQTIERKFQLLEEINGDDLEDLYLENVSDQVLEGSFFFREFLYSDSMYEISVNNLNLENIDYILDNIREEKLRTIVKKVLEIFGEYNGNKKKENIKCLKLGIKQKGIIKINNIKSKGDKELAIRIDTLSKLNKTFSLTYNINNIFGKISNYFRR